MKEAGTAEPNAFVNEHLFGSIPEAYFDNPEQYSNFRAELAEKLAIQLGDIHLVGSARIGFSLNADHLLRVFGADSDLDIVVASTSLFDEASLELIVKQKTI